MEQSGALPVRRCRVRFSRRSLRRPLRNLRLPTMKERSSNLSVAELFLALSRRQSGRNTAAVQQIAHEPVVLSPVVAAARRVMGAQGQPDPPRRPAAGTGAVARPAERRLAPSRG